MYCTEVTDPPTWISGVVGKDASVSSLRKMLYPVVLGLAFQVSVIRPAGLAVSRHARGCGRRRRERRGHQRRHRLIGERGAQTRDQVVAWTGPVVRFSRTVTDRDVVEHRGSSRRRS